MTDKGSMGQHDYLSTACHHGLHERCRKACKFCGVDCNCNCHREGRALAAAGRVAAEDELRKALTEIANGYLGDQTAEQQFIWAQQRCKDALASLHSHKTTGA